MGGEGMNPLLVPKEKLDNLMVDIEVEIERLMGEYGDIVLKTSYLYLKDMQRAEDAFQEVFIKIYRKYGSFKGNSSEKTWIMSITINVCKDMLRNSWLKRVFLMDNLTAEKDEDAVDAKVIKGIEEEILFKEVMALPAYLKDVVILYYYQEFKTVEISKILGIAEGTVRSRLHRAREILKNKLSGRVDYFG
jgi:RNA polymerase sigma-70 factor (ECF subfamily)